MTDRVVQYPARYQLVPVAGTTDQFDLVAVPGTVTAVGDDLNVENLLPGELCTLLGIPASSVPKDALTAIYALANSKAKIEIGSYVGTGTYGNSNPCRVVAGSTPKFIVVQQRVDAETGRTPSLWVGVYNNTSIIPYGYDSSPNIGSAITWGSTTSWYSATSNTQQANESGITYYYIIGY